MFGGGKYFGLRGHKLNLAVGIIAGKASTFLKFWFLKCTLKSLHYIMLTSLQVSTSSSLVMTKV